VAGQAHGRPAVTEVAMWQSELVGGDLPMVCAVTGQPADGWERYNFFVDACLRRPKTDPLRRATRVSFQPARTTPSTRSRMT
jgi:hypothetical protein